MTGPRPRGLLAVGLAATLALAGCSAESPRADDVPAGTSVAELVVAEEIATTSWVSARRVKESKPLAGAKVVVDPGHQLGNKNFPGKINRQVPAGGFSKACNTTGTATKGGYAEATFAWKVSLQIRRRLEKLGAKVILTRSTNSEKHWGPCVDERGRAGNSQGADLKLSIHGDGSYAAGAHGFHVIAPTDRRPWMHDIYRSSRRLATTVRTALHRNVGLDYATYTAGGDGPDFRGDLGTLNLSDVPTVLVELGNMRDAGDARRMTSARGRRVYARALVRAAQRFVRSTPVASAEPYPIGR